MFVSIALMFLAFRTSDMCDPALKLESCCSKVTSYQKPYTDVENRYLIKGSYELNEEKKYYMSHGWSLYKNETTRFWTIEQCSSHLKAYTEYEAECPDEISQEASWKYEGPWGHSRPDDSEIFYFICNE